MVCNNKKSTYRYFANCLIFKWAHLDSNQGPPDYESVFITFLYLVITCFTAIQRGFCVFYLSIFCVIWANCLNYV